MRGKRSKRIPYHCPQCDVYGRGRRCWACGSADVDFENDDRATAGVPAPGTNWR